LLPFHSQPEIALFRNPRRDRNSKHDFMLGVPVPNPPELYLTVLQLTSFNVAI
jgi:hypothetical protein